MDSVSLVWHTEQRKINDLIPFEGNPRTLTEKQVSDLRKSVEKFNIVEIPAINTTNKILAGHQRLKIMQLLGRGEELTDVRVPNRELTPEEEREYLIRSNKNTGDWDWDALANFDAGALVDCGFTSEELTRGFGLNQTPDQDEAPDLQKEPRAKRGQVFILGRHRIMCGDSTDPRDVETLMGGGRNFSGPDFYGPAVQRELFGPGQRDLEHDRERQSTGSAISGIFIKSVCELSRLLQTRCSHVLLLCVPDAPGVRGRAEPERMESQKPDHLGEARGVDGVGRLPVET